MEQRFGSTQVDNHHVKVLIVLPMMILDETRTGKREDPGAGVSGSSNDRLISVTTACW